MSLLLRCSGCLKNVNRMKNINALGKFCSSTVPEPDGVQDHYTTVFHFPHIKVASLINRCKFLQTVTTTLAVPVSVILSTLDVIEAQTGVTAVLLGISLSSFFFIFGTLSDKLIGIVYINEKEETVRFAYLDFWGRRKDLSMPLAEIVPLSETTTSWSDGLYLKVNRRSPVPQIYKINLKFGGIVDHNNFNKIFLVD